MPVRVGGRTPHPATPTIHGNDMENPHSERQAVLLERIVKNAVSIISYHEVIIAILITLGQMHRTHPRTEPLC